MTRISEPSTAGLDDAALLQRFVASHDEAAFNALVLRYGPMVLGICRRVLQSQSDADDAFQATFLLLALKAKRITEPRLLGNWLFGVATRTSIGIRRSNHRRVVQEKRLMRILRPRYRDETKDADLRMMLDEQISKLPEKLRQVLVCCHLEGLTKREAAERLQINDSTIMQRLKQAREILKRRLGARGAELTEASLGTLLVAVTVPVALSSGTVKAATVATSGKAAAAGLATGKVAGASKGTSSAIIAAKAKLAASLLLAGGLAVTGGAVVKPLVIAAPVPAPVQRVEPATPPQSADLTPIEKKTKRMQRLLLSIIMYANGYKDQRLPPDLKTLRYNDPDLEYYGQGLVQGVTMKADVAVVAERPAAAYRGLILVGFIDGHVESMSVAQAQGIIARSKKVIEARAAGRKLPVRISTTQKALQVPLPAEIREALLHNANGVAPLDVSWKKTGFTTLPADAPNQPRLDPIFFKTVERHVIWQSGKWYDWVKGANGNTHDSVFDGAAWLHYDTGRPPRLETLPVIEVFDENDLVSMGYLDRAGVHLPNTGPEMKKHVAVSTVLAHLNAGGVVTAVDSSSAKGHACVRLTIIADDEYGDRRFIYDLDPAMNYAIRHEEERLDGQPPETTDNDLFQQLPNTNVWMPYESVTRYYRKSAADPLVLEPWLGERFEVTELKHAAAADDQFILQPPPPGSQNAIAVAAEKKVDAVAHTGVLAGVQTAPQSIESSSWRWIVAILAGVGAIAITAFGTRRYRRAVY